MHREEFMARLQAMEMPSFSTEVRTVCRLFWITERLLQWKLGLLSDEEYGRESTLYGRFNKRWARGDAAEGVLTRMRVKQDIQVGRRVYGLWSMVYGLGVRDYGLGVRVWDWRVRV